MARHDIPATGESPKDTRTYLNSMFTELYNWAFVNDATEKTTPVDADLIGLWDSVATTLKKLTWANLKVTLKSYFDTLYSTPDGWFAAGETWTYAAADDPTYQFTISGNKITKYSEGMKLRLTQAITTLKAYYRFNTGALTTDD